VRKTVSRAACYLAPVLLIAACPVPATAQPAAAEKIVGGPYTVNVRPQSATVMWLVQTGEATLGFEPGTRDRSVPLLRAEKAAFVRLDRGRTYYYQAFPGEAGKGSFKTPPSGEARFQFVVYGDTRTRDDVHRQVISAILKDAQPDFVIHTGDLVADANDSSLWPTFFDIERELLRKVAFFTTLGNHERDSANYFDFLNAKPYYSFDWGGAHFAAIDSDIATAGETQEQRDAFWQEQTRWLEDDLRRAQKADFRFVFAHHPPMTAVRIRQGENPHMAALEPLFEKYKLSAGLFGHDHNYQHYLKNGIHYFITGGGGAPLYDVDVPPPGITKLVAKTENFLVVRVEGKMLTVEARTPAGKILDSTQLTASNK